MAFFDYYELLGCDPRATAAEITKLYREKAKKLHPDKNLHSNLSAHEVFVRLVKAKEILTDKKKRAMYDRQYRLHLRNKTQNKSKNKEEKKTNHNKKSNKTGSEHNTNTNTKSQDTTNKSNQDSINVTDELVETIIRGSYCKHGFKSSKICEDLHKMLNGARYSVIIMKNFGWSSRIVDSVQVIVDQTIIFAIRSRNRAIVNKAVIKNWLGNEYGWVSGYTDMNKFRDNLRQKSLAKFGKFYNILLFKKMYLVNASFRGLMWDARDNATCIFIGDR